jgi:hypothetical protein
MAYLVLWALVNTHRYVLVAGGVEMGYLFLAAFTWNKTIWLEPISIWLYFVSLCMFLFIRYICSDSLSLLYIYGIFECNKKKYVDYQFYLLAPHCWNCCLLFCVCVCNLSHEVKCLHNITPSDTCDIIYQTPSNLIYAILNNQNYQYKASQVHRNGFVKLKHRNCHVTILVLVTHSLCVINHSWISNVPYIRLLAYILFPSILQIQVL